MPEQFEQLAEIFENARVLKGNQRASYLNQACAKNSALHRQVLALLNRHDSDGVLDEPIRPAEIPSGPMPERIGRFRILGYLGRGGMGVVYRAEQDQPQRQVALKVMHAGLVSEELRKRFEFETSVLAKLQHPGIAQIYEVGTWKSSGGRQPFFAMELVDGTSLDAYVANVEPNLDKRLQLMMSICQAVHHAHQKGVIHRDLKPANILVTSDGTPKILDFGVARATDADLRATQQTTPGQLVGTLAYMSPEQVGMNSDALDTRSDVYALGVIFYELLTGLLPYELGSGNIASAIRAIEEAEPRSLTFTDKRLRGDLETIVKTALRKRPENRYQSAADLAADVKRYIEHQPIIARPATALYQLTRFARRHRGFVAGVVVALLALVGGSGAVVWQASVARSEARMRTDIADFLRDILTSVEPEKTGGDELTVREMLDDASVRLLTQFQGTPIVRAELHDTIGSTYFSLGAYAEAEKHMRSALSIFRKEFGQSGDPSLFSMAELGVVLTQLDRLDEALQILKDAQLLVQDPDSEAAALIDSHLGMALDASGRKTEALHLFRQTYLRELDHRGPKDRETLRAQNNLGKILLDLNRYDQALPHILKSLEGRREVLGVDHPETITSIANLGALYAQMGRTEEAYVLIADAAERSRRVLGPTHLRTIRRNQNELRMKIFRKNDTAEARTMALDQLLQCERVLGREHRDTLTSLELAVTAMAFDGATDEAQAMALEWYHSFEKKLSPNHIITGRVAYLLQNLYEEMKDKTNEDLWKKRVAQSTFSPP